MPNNIIKESSHKIDKNPHVTEPFNYTMVKEMKDKMSTLYPSRIASNHLNNKQLLTFSEDITYFSTTAQQSLINFPQPIIAVSSNAETDCTFNKSNKTDLVSGSGKIMQHNDSHQILIDKSLVCDAFVIAKCKLVNKISPDTEMNSKYLPSKTSPVDVYNSMADCSTMDISHHKDRCTANKTFRVNRKENIEQLATAGCSDSYPVIIGDTVKIYDTKLYALLPLLSKCIQVQNVHAFKMELAYMSNIYGDRYVFTHYIASIASYV